MYHDSVVTAHLDLIESTVLYKKFMNLYQKLYKLSKKKKCYRIYDFTNSRLFSNNISRRTFRLNCKELFPLKRHVLQDAIGY